MRRGTQWGLGKIRPSIALARVNPHNTANTWLSDCKICRHGIYKADEYDWFNSPLGLSHLACARGEGLL